MNITTTLITDSQPSKLVQPGKCPFNYPASLTQTATIGGSRPVSVEVMAELSKYVCSLDIGQEKLFKTKFNHRKWRRICKDVGSADLKFHDLRKTFGSLLAQNGVSTAVTRKLLEHSSPYLTNKVYTNVDPVLRSAVEQLPVGDWL